MKNIAMFKSTYLFSAAVALLFQPILADDGQQLFTLYCSACHGVDGKGATGGAFPPLAGSEWLTGNPKRSIAIVLHGLNGPISVSGKTYNLEMQSHGAVLNDGQIKDILTYVHSAWGNQGGKIPGNLVGTVRAEFAGRSQPWTAPELLQLYPLDVKETALKNLTSRVYKGEWGDLPDFSKITAENVEEEPSGLIKLGVTNLEKSYGITWEGNFITPEDGAFEFFLDADDGARIVLNGSTLCEVAGIGPMGNRVSKASITLKKGPVPIRVEYFQAAGEKGLKVGWRKTDAKQFEWLTEDTGIAAAAFPEILLAPGEGKAIVYRNFIGGTTPRAIAFGFPGGVNLAYSADHLAPELVWLGDFINAGRHWTDRGQGDQEPASALVKKLTTTRFLPEAARFKGYQLDPNGNPTFHIAIGDQLLSDSWKPGESDTLVRTLSLNTGPSIEIPLGDSAVTGAEKITVSPGNPATLVYKLK